MSHNKKSENLDINFISLFTNFLNNFEVKKLDILYELGKLVLSNNKNLTIQFL